MHLMNRFTFNCIRRLYARTGNDNDRVITDLLRPKSVNEVKRQLRNGRGSLTDRNERSPAVHDKVNVYGQRKDDLDSGGYVGELLRNRYVIASNSIKPIPPHRNVDSLTGSVIEAPGVAITVGTSIAIPTSMNYHRYYVIGSMK